MKKILNFIQTETVLSISLALAVLSVIWVPLDAAYLNYIDFRTLALLLCLMSVVGGLQKQGIFRILGRKLVGLAGNTRGVSCVLVLLCFLFSMLITNDVALITFVPFAMIVLQACDMEAYMIYVIVLQTIAANLGSMLTPVGNPQNLYLYAMAGMTGGELTLRMLPYGLLALVLLLLLCCFIPKKEIAAFPIAEKRNAPSRRLVFMYLLLFICSLMTVFHLLPYAITLLLTLAMILIADRRILKGVDYSLLMTFAALFLFIGNLSRIESVRHFLTEMVSGREVLVGVAASQIFSNVPAAILLSKFTSQLPQLMIGVNIGGLGTLIASMASLISYRLYTRGARNRLQYLKIFTGLNLIFLAAELLLWKIMSFVIA